MSAQKHVDFSFLFKPGELENLQNGSDFVIPVDEDEEDTPQVGQENDVIQWSEKDADENLKKHSKDMRETAQGNEDIENEPPSRFTEHYGWLDRERTPTGRVADLSDEEKDALLPLIAEWSNEWTDASPVDGGQSYSAWAFIDEIRGEAEAQFAIPDILPRGETMMIAASAGVGKTWLGCKVAVEVSSGQPILSTREHDGGNALYCLTEGKAGFSKRLEAHLEQAGQGKENCNVYVRTDLPQLIHSGEYGRKVSDGWTWFVKIRLSQHYGLIPQDLRILVVDYLREASLGAAENSNDDMAIVMRSVNQLARALNTGVMCLHHQGANDEKVGRGATVVRDMAYCYFKLSGKIDGSDGALLTVDKSPKDRPAPAPVRLKLDTARRGCPTVKYTQAGTVEAESADMIYNYLCAHPNQYYSTKNLMDVLNLRRPNDMTDRTWKSRIERGMSYMEERPLDYMYATRAPQKGVKFDDSLKKEKG